MQKALLKNLATLGFAEMTPIQSQSLPIMLQGLDVIAQARTGSGKTAAFGLALLNQIAVENYAVQALVLCPTRELADQVSQALRRLARLLPNVKILNISGGSPLKPQLDSLRHGAHIIVGTPGRVLKHLAKETLSLRDLKILVLDEADRMLDMGFFTDIKTLITACPKRRQTLLFSATYPAEIKKLSRQFMANPTEILLKVQPTESDIEEIYFESSNPDKKFALLKSILLHYQPVSTLIFCNTKQTTADLAAKLNHEGYSALALNGDLEQAERDQVLIRFTQQSISILVATDVAARGLDIKELPFVINYELAFESDAHIHRIGRTGRAGHKGLAISITSAQDAERLQILKNAASKALTWGIASELNKSLATLPPPAMVTVCLDAGKKDKIRPGDILGALTKDAGIPGTAIGNIAITAMCSYVAIQRDFVEQAYRYLLNGKLKGRKVSAKKLR